MGVYQSTFPIDQFGNRFVQNDMGKDTETRAEFSRDIKGRKAYFAGSCIGSPIATGYLLPDAQMPGEKITCPEQFDVAGGSFDEQANLLFYQKQYWFILEHK